LPSRQREPDSRRGQNSPYRPESSVRAYPLPDTCVRLNSVGLGRRSTNRRRTCRWAPTGCRSPAAGSAPTGWWSDATATGPG